MRPEPPLETTLARCHHILINRCAPELGYGPLVRPSRSAAPADAAKPNHHGRAAVKYVLFVCNHNAGRSQMAQAFFERFAPR